MKTLDKCTTDEILEELEKRKTVDQEATNDIPCVGIVDSFGLDSIVPLKDAKHFTGVTPQMELRCRFNTGRNAEMFFIKLPQVILDNLKKISYEEQGKMIKGFSNYKKIF